MTVKHTFFAPDAQEGDFLLPESEARHAERVLRLKEGDLIQVVTGAGSRGVGRLVNVTRRAVGVRVEELVDEAPGLTTEVILGAALIKNSGRFETMLEKVAELGVRRVVPLLTHRIERSRFRVDRARGILVGAMKQSGSAYLTEIAEPVSLEAFLGSTHAGLRLICHEQTAADQSLALRLQSGDARRVVIAIGPEGGFTDQEIEAATDAGFLTTSLGRTRLRAETAAIVAAAGINLFENGG